MSHLHLLLRIRSQVGTPEKKQTLWCRSRFLRDGKSKTIPMCSMVLVHLHNWAVSRGFMLVTRKPAQWAASGIVPPRSVVGVAKDHGATHPGHYLRIDHVVDENVHLCLTSSSATLNPLWGHLFKTAAEVEVKWC